jgi:hypothetical protein
MADKIEITIKNKSGNELLECEMNTCPNVGEKLDIDYKSEHQEFKGKCRVVEVIHKINAFLDTNRIYPEYYEGNYVILVVEMEEE